MDKFHHAVIVRLLQRGNPMPIFKTYRFEDKTEAAAFAEKVQIKMGAEVVATSSLNVKCATARHAMDNLDWMMKAD